MSRFAVVAPELVTGGVQLTAVADQLRGARDRLLMGADAHVVSFGASQVGNIEAMVEDCVGALSRLLEDLQSLGQGLQSAAGTYVEADGAILRRTGAR